MKEKKFHFTTRPTLKQDGGGGGQKLSDCGSAPPPHRPSTVDLPSMMWWTASSLPVEWSHLPLLVGKSRTFPCPALSGLCYWHGDWQVSDGLDDSLIKYP